MNIRDIMLLSFFCTELIELFFAFLIGIKKKDSIFVFLVNVLTNPLVVSISFFIQLRYGVLIKRCIMFILEGVILFLEGFIYSKVLDYKKRSPYLISALLNGASYFLGLLINYLVW